MPLSPSDVQFINKRLDQHLKNQRSWPWARYFSIGSGALLIMTGIVLLWFSQSIGEFSLSVATTHHADPSSTQPVAQGVFLNLIQSSDQMAQGYARLEANMAALRLAIIIVAAINLYIGFHLISMTLVRWNRHRRDAILITLLREKCVAELAMPNDPASK